MVLGKFKNKNRYCNLCKWEYTGYEEKTTDVNIAVYLFKLAYEDRFDIAFIVSGDTDLTHAIQVFKNTFTRKKIGFIFPMERKNVDLADIADFSYKIKESHLIKSRFPDNVNLRNGTVITCPSNWL